MIKVSNLNKSYGAQVLFQDVSFNVNSGERIGLVGRNGHGKTTLLRLLLGQEEPDSGEICVPKDYILGHLRQHLHFTQPTVLTEACLGLPADREHDTWRVEKILFGLGFTEADLDRPPAEFSGGFQIRLNLAKVLVSDPDMLLLDEPTNYLDIVSVRWLIKFLQSWKKEMILVTHDRGFMDQVTTHTLGIHRGKVRKIAGTTDKLYAQLDMEEEVHERTRANDEKKRREVELFITRFRAKARLAGLVQSRVKQLAKQEKLDALEKIPTLDFEFRAEPFPSKVMLEASEVAFSYSGQRPYLLESLGLTIGERDRIGVIGKNGKGKSTLLRLLAGELEPVAGTIKQHPRLKMGYFGQTNVERLHPEHTVEDALMAADTHIQRRQARDVAGAMMFSGDLALKKISVLSGGERSRVLLGKILLTPVNLLLLDEPTNHLDMHACEALLAAAHEFDGSVVLVTHDELFLHALANKLVVFDNDQVTVFHGTYQDFLDTIGWQDERPAAGGDGPSAAGVLRSPAAAGEPEAPTPVAGLTPEQKKRQKAAKAEVLHEKAKVLKPLVQRVLELERMIERMEAECAALDQQLLAAATHSDVPALAELPKQQRDAKQKLDFLYQELDRAEAAQNLKAAEFTQRLEKFEI